MTDPQTLPEIGVFYPEQGCTPIKITENWIVGIMPMIFNDRIVLSEIGEWNGGLYTAGWCYDKGPAAVVAAMAWDPESEREPVGYKKRAYDGRL
jgi:hypothetical protein